MPILNSPAGSVRRRVLAYADTPGFSGAESVFCEVVNGLGRREEIALSVALARSNREMARALRGSAAAQVLEVPGHPPRISSAGLLDPRRHRAIRDVVHRTAPDLILVNLPGPDYGATPLLHPRGAGPAEVAVLHLHQSLRSRGARLGAVRDRLARAYLCRLDHLFVISPTGGPEASSTWGVPSDRCSVLPLAPRAISAGDRSEARSALGLDPLAPIVGIVGRVDVRQKGHDTFIAAAVALVEKREDLTFAVVGAGPDTDRVRELAYRAGLEGRVAFTGSVAPVEVAYAALDAIAIPSRFEGLPLTALEALAVGLAGVAAKVDGLASVWPREWQVPPDDPAALASALDAVLALDSGRATRILATARHRAEEEIEGDPGEAVASVIRRLHVPERHP